MGVLRKAGTLVEGSLLNLFEKQLSHLPHGHIHSSLQGCWEFMTIYERSTRHDAGKY